MILRLAKDPVIHGYNGIGAEDDGLLTHCCGILHPDPPFLLFLFKVFPHLLCNIRRFLQRQLPHDSLRRVSRWALRKLTWNNNRINPDLL